MIRAVELTAVRRTRAEFVPIVVAVGAAPVNRILPVRRCRHRVVLWMEAGLVGVCVLFLAVEEHKQEAVLTLRHHVVGLIVWVLAANFVIRKVVLQGPGGRL